LVPVGELAIEWVWMRAAPNLNCIYIITDQYFLPQKKSIPAWVKLAHPPDADRDKSFHCDRDVPMGPACGKYASMQLAGMI
jgi:hypothetical protein